MARPIRTAHRWIIAATTAWVGLGLWGCSESRCVDADEDGYFADYPRCWEADKADCNDGDPALNYDDLDGDGYHTCHETWFDCDDLDAGRHPRADEVPCDGVDQDCDGQDLDGLEINATITWPHDQSADVHPNTFLTTHVRDGDS